MSFQSNKGQKPDVRTPKYIPEKNSKTQEEKPNTKPSQEPKNKIERQKLQPRNKPKNKIERAKIPPNSNPKNKILIPKLRLNDKPKNSIKRQKPPPNAKQKNKIERAKIPPNYKQKNKIEKPKLPPNYKPRNKKQPPGGSEVNPQLNPHEVDKKSEPNPKPLNNPGTETRKNVTQSKWAFLNYDTNGNKILKDQKLQNAADYFNKKILPELKNDPTINRKIEENRISVNDIISKGYSGFINALNRGKTNKIKWSELKSSLSFNDQSPKNKIDILEQNKSLKNDPNEKPNGKPTNLPRKNWNFINYDINNNPLNQEQKLKVVIDFYKEKILPDLKSKPEITEKLEKGKGIGVRDLDKHGYSGFLNSLANVEPKIKWNQFKEEAGYRVNIDQNKYRFINYDQNGNRLTREQKIEVAIKHFNEIILPDLQMIPNIKNKIEQGYPPSIIDIREHGHVGFVAPLCDKEPKIKYNELIERVGLKANTNHDKYRFLNYNNNGELITHEQKLQEAKKYFKTEIIPCLVKENIIKPGDTPGIREIVKGGYSGFFPALAFRGQKIDYNQLVTATGLKPNITQGKWDFIKYDRDGNVLSKNEKFDNAVDYFSKIVYPDLVQKGIVKEAEPPTSRDLIYNNHEDFLSSLRGKEPKVSFNHFIEYAGFEPKSYQTLSAIGQDFHWNAEKIFMEHTRNHNCNSFYEVNENGDNSVIINEDFKKLSPNIEFFVHIRPDIKVINVDYYLGASIEHARIHSTGGYQDKGKALFLVSVKASEPQPIEYQAPHHNNIFILDTKNFALFMGYQEKVYDEFMETVELTKKAIYDEDSREILREKAIESIEVIKNKRNQLDNSTKEFEELMKENNYLK